jgi:hypothetical protein
MDKIKFSQILLQTPKLNFIKIPSEVKSRDSSFGISLGYRLDVRGSRVRLPEGARNFSLHHRVQNGSGAHPASYPMSTRGPFLESKAAEAWSWPLTSILCRGQRMSGVIHPLPQYAFMAWCSVKAQGYFYLYLLSVQKFQRRNMHKGKRKDPHDLSIKRSFMQFLEKCIISLLVFVKFLMFSNCDPHFWGCL